MVRCLIVDDDELGRELLATQLEPYATSDLASDGYDAVAKFTAALLEGNPYQLIFLDIVMPEMDGNAAARAIRNLEQERGIPVERGVNIVVLSSLNTPQDIIQAYVSAQSAAHLVKPVRLDRLLKTLRTLELIPQEQL